jgi:hypothetical protein
MKIFGLLLILAGIAALAYGGISYTTHRRALSMGPVHINSSHHHHIPLPSLLGIGGILVGGALVAGAGSRKP